MEREKTIKRFWLLWLTIVVVSVCGLLIGLRIHLQITVKGWVEDTQNPDVRQRVTAYVGLTKNAEHPIARSFWLASELTMEAADTFFQQNLSHVPPEVIVRVGVWVVDSATYNDGEYYDDVFTRANDKMVSQGPRLAPILLHTLEKLATRQDDWNDSSLVFMDLLGELGDQRAGPILMNFMDSSINILRVNAILALGEMKYYPAIPRLISLLDPDAKIPTFDAIAALGCFPDTKALQAVKPFTKPGYAKYRVVQLEAISGVENIEAELERRRD